MNAMKLSLAALLVTAGVSAARAGSNLSFQVVNHSNLTADGFTTQQNGQWSSNWLSSAIGPGGTSTLTFSSDGDCVVPTQVHFTDNTYFDYDVDYCKASRLHIYSQEIKWD